MITNWVILSSNGGCFTKWTIDGAAIALFRKLTSCCLFSSNEIKIRHFFSNFQKNVCFFRGMLYLYRLLMEFKSYTWNLFKTVRRDLVHIPYVIFAIKVSSCFDLTIYFRYLIGHLTRKLVNNALILII